MVTKVKHPQGFSPAAEPPVRKREDKAGLLSDLNTNIRDQFTQLAKDVAQRITQPILTRIGVGVQLGMVGAAVLGKKIEEIAEPLVGQARHFYLAGRVQQLKAEAAKLPPVFARELTALEPDLAHYDASLNLDALAKDIDRAEFLIAEYRELATLPDIDTLSNDAPERYQAAWVNAIETADHRAQHIIFRNHRLIAQRAELNDALQESRLTPTQRHFVATTDYLLGDLNTPLADKPELDTATASLSATTGAVRLHTLSFDGRLHGHKAADLFADTMRKHAEKLLTHPEQLWTGTAPEHARDMAALQQALAAAATTAAAPLTLATKDRLLEALSWMGDHDTRRELLDASRSPSATQLSSLPNKTRIALQYAGDILQRRGADIARWQTLVPWAGVKDARQLEYHHDGWGGTPIGAMNDNAITRAYREMTQSENPNEQRQAERAKAATRQFVDRFNDITREPHDLSLASDAGWAALEKTILHDSATLDGLDAVLARAEGIAERNKPSDPTQKRIEFLAAANRLLGAEGRNPGHTSDAQVTRGHYAISDSMLNFMKKNYPYGISHAIAEQRLALVMTDGVDIETRRNAAMVYEYYLYQQEQKGRSRMWRELQDSPDLGIRATAEGVIRNAQNEKHYEPTVYETIPKIVQRQAQFNHQYQPLAALKTLRDYEDQITASKELIQEYTLTGKKKTAEEKFIYQLNAGMAVRIARLIQDFDPLDLDKKLTEIREARKDIHVGDMNRFSAISHAIEGSQTLAHVQGLTEEAVKVNVARDLVREGITFAAATIATAGIAPVLELATQTVRVGAAARGAVAGAQTLSRFKRAQQIATTIAKASGHAVVKQGTFLHTKAAAELAIAGHQTLYDPSASIQDNLFNLGVSIVEFELMGGVHKAFKEVWTVAPVAERAGILRQLVSGTRAKVHELVRDVVFFHGWLPAAGIIKTVAHGDAAHFVKSVDDFGSQEGLAHTAMMTLSMGTGLGTPLSQKLSSAVLRSRVPEIRKVSTHQKQIEKLEHKLADVKGHSLKALDHIAELRHQQLELAQQNAQLMDTAAARHPESEALRAQAKQMHLIVNQYFHANRHAERLWSLTQMQQAETQLKEDYTTANDLQAKRLILEDLRDTFQKRVDLARTMFAEGTLDAHTLIETEHHHRAMSLEERILGNAEKIEAAAEVMAAFTPGTPVEQISDLVATLLALYSVQKELVHHSLKVIPRRFPPEALRKVNASISLLTHALETPVGIRAAAKKYHDLLKEVRRGADYADTVSASLYKEVALLEKTKSRKPAVRQKLLSEVAKKMRARHQLTLQYVTQFGAPAKLTTFLKAHAATQTDLLHRAMTDHTQIPLLIASVREIQDRFLTMRLYLNATNSAQRHKLEAKLERADSAATPVRPRGMLWSSMMLMPFPLSLVFAGIGSASGLRTVSSPRRTYPVGSILFETGIPGIGEFPLIPKGADLELRAAIGEAQSGTLDHWMANHYLSKPEAERYDLMVQLGSAYHNWVSRVETRVRSALAQYESGGMTADNMLDLQRSIRNEESGFRVVFDAIDHNPELPISDPQKRFASNLKSSAIQLLNSWLGALEVVAIDIQAKAPPNHAEYQELLAPNILRGTESGYPPGMGVPEGVHEIARELIWWLNGRGTLTVSNSVFTWEAPKTESIAKGTQTTSFDRIPWPPDLASNHYLRAMTQFLGWATTVTDHGDRVRITLHPQPKTVTNTEGDAAPTLGLVGGPLMPVHLIQTFGQLLDRAMDAGRDLLAARAATFQARAEEAAAAIEKLPEGEPLPAALQRTKAKLEAEATAIEAELARAAPEPGPTEPVPSAAAPNPPVKAVAADANSASEIMKATRDLKRPQSPEDATPRSQKSYVPMSAWRSHPDIVAITPPDHMHIVQDGMIRRDVDMADKGNSYIISDGLAHFAGYVKLGQSAEGSALHILWALTALEAHSAVPRPHRRRAPHIQDNESSMEAHLREAYQTHGQVVEDAFRYMQTHAREIAEFGKIPQAEVEAAAQKYLRVLKLNPEPPAPVVVVEPAPPKRLTAAAPEVIAQAIQDNLALLRDIESTSGGRTTPRSTLFRSRMGSMGTLGATMQLTHDVLIDATSGRILKEHTSQFDTLRRDGHEVERVVLRLFNVIASTQLNAIRQRLVAEGAHRKTTVPAWLQNEIRSAPTDSDLAYAYAQAVAEAERLGTPLTLHDIFLSRVRHAELSHSNSVPKEVDRALYHLRGAAFGKSALPTPDPETGGPKGGGTGGSGESAGRHLRATLPERPQPPPPYSSQHLDTTDLFDNPKYMIVKKLTFELRRLAFGVSRQFSQSLPTPDVEQGIETNMRGLALLLQHVALTQDLPLPNNGIPLKTPLEAYWRVLYDSMRNKPILERIAQHLDDNAVRWGFLPTHHADILKQFKNEDAAHHGWMGDPVLMAVVRGHRKLHYAHYDNAAIAKDIEARPTMPVDAIQQTLQLDLLHAWDRVSFGRTPDEVFSQLAILLRRLERHPDLPRPEGRPAIESALQSYLLSIYLAHPEAQLTIEENLRMADSIAEQLFDNPSSVRFLDVVSPHRSPNAGHLKEDSLFTAPADPNALDPNQATGAFSGVYDIQQKGFAAARPTSAAIETPRRTESAIYAALPEDIQEAAEFNASVLEGNSPLAPTHYSYRAVHGFSSSLGSHDTPNAAHNNIPGYIDARNGQILALTHTQPKDLMDRAEALPMTLRTFNPSRHPELTDMMRAVIEGTLSLDAPIPDHILSFIQSQPPESLFHQAHAHAVAESGGAPAEVLRALSELVGTPIIAVKPKDRAAPPLPGLPAPLAGPDKVTKYSGVPFVEEFVRLMFAQGAALKVTDPDFKSLKDGQLTEEVLQNADAYALVYAEIFSNQRIERALMALNKFIQLVRSGHLDDSTIREGAQGMASALINGFAGDQSPIAPHSLLFYAHRLLGLSERNPARDRNDQTRIWEDEALSGFKRYLSQQQPDTGTTVPATLIPTQVAQLLQKRFTHGIQPSIQRFELFKDGGLLEGLSHDAILHWLFYEGNASVTATTDRLKAYFPILKQLPDASRADMFAHGLVNADTLDDLAATSALTPETLGQIVPILVAAQGHQWGRIHTLLTQNGYSHGVASRVMQTIQEIRSDGYAEFLGDVFSYSNAALHREMSTTPTHLAKQLKIQRLARKADLPLPEAELHHMVANNADVLIDVVTKGTLGAVSAHGAIAAYRNLRTTIDAILPNQSTLPTAAQPLARVMISPHHALKLEKGEFEAALGLQLSLFDTSGPREQRIATIGFHETDDAVEILRFQGARLGEETSERGRTFRKFSGGMAPLPWLGQMAGQLLLHHARLSGKELHWVRGERLLFGYPHIEDLFPPHVRTIDDARKPWKQEWLEQMTEDHPIVASYRRGPWVQKMYDETAAALGFDPPDADAAFHVFTRGALAMRRETGGQHDQAQLDRSLENATIAMRHQTTFGRWLMHLDRPRVSGDGKVQLEMRIPGVAEAVTAAQWMISGAVKLWDWWSRPKLAIEADPVAVHQPVTPEVKPAAEAVHAVPAPEVLQIQDIPAENRRVLTELGANPGGAAPLAPNSKLISPKPLTDFISFHTLWVDPKTGLIQDSESRTAKSVSIKVTSPLNFFRMRDNQWILSRLIQDRHITHDGTVLDAEVPQWLRKEIMKWGVRHPMFVVMGHAQKDAVARAIATGTPASLAEATTRPTLHDLFHSRIDEVTISVGKPSIPTEIAKELKTLRGSLVGASPLRERGKPGIKKSDNRTTHYMAIGPDLKFVAAAAQAAIQGLRTFFQRGTNAAPQPAPTAPRIETVDGQDRLIILPGRTDTQTMMIDGMPEIEFRWRRGHMEIRDMRTPKPASQLSLRRPRAASRIATNDIPLLINGQPHRAEAWYQLKYGDTVQLGHRVCEVSKSPGHVQHLTPPKGTPPAQEAPQAQLPNAVDPQATARRPMDTPQIPDDVAVDPRTLKVSAELPIWHTVSNDTKLHLQPYVDAILETNPQRRRDTERDLTLAANELKEFEEGRPPTLHDMNQWIATARKRHNSSGYHTYHNPHESDPNKAATVIMDMESANQIWIKDFTDGVRQLIPEGLIPGFPEAATPERYFIPGGEHWWFGGDFLKLEGDTAIPRYEGRIFFGVDYSQDDHRGVPKAALLYAKLHELALAMKKEGSSIQFKITAKRQGRNDAGVLYFHAKDQERIYKAMLEISRLHVTADRLPLFVAPLTNEQGDTLPGIGFAQHPKDSGTSFGSRRTQAIAHARHTLEDEAGRGVKRPREELEGILTAALDAAGIDPDIPAFDKGGRGLFPFLYRHMRFSREGDAPTATIHLPPLSGLPPPLAGSDKVTTYSGAPWVTAMLNDALVKVAKVVGNTFKKLPISATANFEDREAARAAREPEIAHWVRTHMFNRDTVRFFEESMVDFAQRYQVALTTLKDPQDIRALHDRWRSESALFVDIVTAMFAKAQTPQEQALAARARNCLYSGPFSMVGALLEARMELPTTLHDAVNQVLQPDYSTKASSRIAKYMDRPLVWAHTLRVGFSSPRAQSTKPIQAMIDYTLLVETGALPTDELRKGAFDLSQTLVNGFAGDQSPIAPHTLLFYANRLLGVSERKATLDRHEQASLWEEEILTAFVRRLPPTPDEPSRKEIGFNDPRAAENTIPDLPPALEGPLESSYSGAPWATDAGTQLVDGARRLWGKLRHGAEPRDLWKELNGDASAIYAYIGAAMKRGEKIINPDTGAPFNDASLIGYVNRRKYAGGIPIPDLVLSKPEPPETKIKTYSGAANLAARAKPATHTLRPPLGIVGGAGEYPELKYPLPEGRAIDAFSPRDTRKIFSHFFGGKTEPGAVTTALRRSRSPAEAFVQLLDQRAKTQLQKKLGRKALLTDMDLEAERNRIMAEVLSTALGGANIPVAKGRVTVTSEDGVLIVRPSTEADYGHIDNAVADSGTPSEPVTGGFFCNINALGIPIVLINPAKGTQAWSIYRHEMQHARQYPVTRAHPHRELVGISMVKDNGTLDQFAVDFFAEHSAVHHFLIGAHDEALAYFAQGEVATETVWRLTHSKLYDFIDHDHDALLATYRTAIGDSHIDTLFGNDAKFKEWSEAQIKTIRAHYTQAITKDVYALHAAHAALVEKGHHPEAAKTLLIKHLSTAQDADWPLATRRLLKTLDGKAPQRNIPKGTGLDRERLNLRRRIEREFLSSDSPSGAFRPVIAAEIQKITAAIAQASATTDVTTLQNLRRRWAAGTTPLEQMSEVLHHMSDESFALREAQVQPDATVDKTLSKLYVLRRMIVHALSRSGLEKLRDILDRKLLLHAAHTQHTLQTNARRAIDAPTHNAPSLPRLRPADVAAMAPKDRFRQVVRLRTAIASESDAMERQRAVHLYAALVRNGELSDYRLQREFDSMSAIVLQHPDRMPDLKLAFAAIRGAAGDALWHSFLERASPQLAEIANRDPKFPGMFKRTTIPLKNPIAKARTSPIGSSAQHTPPPKTPSRVDPEREYQRIRREINERATPAPYVDRLGRPHKSTDVLEALVDFRNKPTQAHYDKIPEIPGLTDSFLAAHPHFQRPTHFGWNFGNNFDPDRRAYIPLSNGPPCEIIDLSKINVSLKDTPVARPLGVTRTTPPPRHVDSREPESTFTVALEQHGLDPQQVKEWAVKKESGRIKRNTVIYAGAATLAASAAIAIVATLFSRDDDDEDTDASPLVLSERTVSGIQKKIADLTVKLKEVSPTAAADEDYGSDIEVRGRNMADARVYSKFITLRERAIRKGERITANDLETLLNKEGVTDLRARLQFYKLASGYFEHVAATQKRLAKIVNIEDTIPTKISDADKIAKFIGEEFGFVPKGKVELMVRDVHIMTVFHDPTDYAAASAPHDPLWRKDPKEYTDEERARLAGILQFAERTAGMSFGRGVTIQKHFGFSGNAEILKHEEGHEMDALGPYFARPINPWADTQLAPRLHEVSSNPEAELETADKLLGVLFGNAQYSFHTEFIQYLREGGRLSKHNPLVKGGLYDPMIRGNYENVIKARYAKHPELRDEVLKRLQAKYDEFYQQADQIYATLKRLDEHFENDPNFEAEHKAKLLSYLAIRGTRDWDLDFLQSFKP